MWLFTTTGFFSVVANERDERTLMVRARAEEDLDALLIEAGIDEGVVIKTPHADYPFRIIINKQDFATWLGDHALNVNYFNFKNHILEKMGLARELVYARVWSVLRAGLDVRHAPTEPAPLESSRPRARPSRRTKRSS